MSKNKMGSTKGKDSNPGKEVEPQGSTSPSEVERQLAVKIGERITQIRGDLTQKDFARTIDRNFGSIGLYERGLRTPIIDVVNKICEVHHINHQWLLTGEGPMKKGETPGADRREAAELPKQSTPGEPEKIILPLNQLYPGALPYDEKLLKEIIVEIEEILVDRGQTLRPTKKAEIIAMLYEQFKKNEMNKGTDKATNQIARLLSVVL